MTKNLYTLTLYNQINRFENIVLQSNLNGYYEKRFTPIMEEIIYVLNNHRKIGINETLFDVDTHLREISNKIVDFISSGLIEDGISHSVWDTSRSPHIHAFFNDLHLYPKEIRVLIKNTFLRHYSGKYSKFIDFNKTSEDVMIRDFEGQHEVTGKKKICVFEYINPKTKGANLMPRHITEKAKEAWFKFNNMPKVEFKATIHDLKPLQDFVGYCLTHRFDLNNYRNNKLLKNVAIACNLLSLDDKYEVYRKITNNCKGKSIKELEGWDLWVSKQRKPLEVNFRELRGFYEQLLH